MNDPFIVNTISNIAANLSVALLTTGAAFLQRCALGSKEEQALERVYQPAFAAIYELVGDVVDPATDIALKDTLYAFVEDKRSAEMILGSVLQGRKLPVRKLRDRFVELGLDHFSPYWNFDGIIRGFAGGLSHGIDNEVRKPDSPLYNYYSAEQLMLIRGNLQRLQRSLPTIVRRVIATDRENRTNLEYDQSFSDYLRAIRIHALNFPYLVVEEILGSDEKQLSDIYVQLRVQPGSSQVTLEGLDAGGEFGISSILKVLTGIREDAAVTLNPLGSDKALNTVLILGQPGAGKSTLLRQLAQCAWHAPHAIGLDKPHVPMIVRLQSLALAEGASVETRVLKALHKASELLLQQDPPSGFFKEWPLRAKSHWLLLFDGLDEVPSLKREELLAWIRKLIPFLKQTGAIVLFTSRPDADLAIKLGRTTFTFELLPFSAAQQSEFAVRWFGDVSELFLHELSRVHVETLAGTPLLLTIAAAVFGKDGHIPQQRSRLYERFVSVWLEEAKRQRRLGEELGEELTDIARWGLEHLALVSTEQPDEFSMASMGKFAAEYLGDVLGTTHARSALLGKRFVSVLGNHSAIFNCHGRLCNWLHPTFREYLAASALARMYSPDDPTAWKYIGLCLNPRWREVVIFLLCFWSEANGDISSIVNKILQDPPLIRRGHSSYTRIHVLGFVGSVIAAGASVGTRVEESIVEELIRSVRVAHMSEPYTQTQALNALENLGSREHVIMGLLSLAHDSTLPGYLRQVSAEVLTRLERSEEATRAWLALALDARVDAHVIVEATKAIKRFASETAVSPLLTTVANDSDEPPAKRLRSAEMLQSLGDVKNSAIAYETLVEAVGISAPGLPQLGDVLLLHRAIDNLRRLSCQQELATLASNTALLAIVRVLAAEALEQMRCMEGAYHAFLSLLESPQFNMDAALTLRAAKALGRMSYTDVSIPHLLRLALTRETDPYVSHSAVDALKDLYHHVEARAALLALVNQSDVLFAVRQHAAAVLEDKGFGSISAE